MEKERETLKVLLSSAFKNDRLLAEIDKAICKKPMIGIDESITYNNIEKVMKTVYIKYLLLKTPVERPKFPDVGVSSSTISVIKNDKIVKKIKKEINIGLMSKKQLKKKLNELPEIKKDKNMKTNRNGKEGVNKSNNYQYIPNTPRKACFKCGNTNHLATNCKVNEM